VWFCHYIFYLMLKSGLLFSPLSHQTRFVVNYFFISSKIGGIYLFRKKFQTLLMHVFIPYGNSALVLSLNFGTLRIRSVDYLAY